MAKKLKRDAQISLRLPSELLATLRALAEADRRPLANYIHVVLEEHAEAVKKGKR